MAYTWPDQLERMERLRRAASEQKTKIYVAGAQESLPDRWKAQTEDIFHLEFNRVA